MNINFYDIQTEYKYFVNQINNTHSCLNHTIEDLKKFLETYYKLKNYNEIFGDNTELNLANLKYICECLEDIIEFTQNITLLESEPPKAKIYNIDDYINIPDNYEEDAFVDSDYPIDLSELWNDNNLP